MDFQAELDALLLEDIENRRETLGEVRVAGVDHVLRDRRERVQEVPDRAAGEAVDDADAELLGRPGGVDHVLRSPLLDAFRLAVAPDLGREDGLVTLVDVVADALADQVVRDGEHLQPVLVEHRPLGLAVLVVLEGLVDLEVVAPAGQFQAVIAPALGLLRQDLQRQVRPLSREKRYRSCHPRTSLSKRLVAHLLQSVSSQRKTLTIPVLLRPHPVAWPSWPCLHGLQARATRHRGEGVPPLRREAILASSLGARQPRSWSRRQDAGKTQGRDGLATSTAQGLSSPASQGGTGHDPPWHSRDVHYTRPPYASNVNFPPIPGHGSVRIGADRMTQAESPAHTVESLRSSRRRSGSPRG